MKAVVVGAGIGGLSVALRLRRAGWEVEVLERNGRPGGRADRLDQEGFRFDAGPSLLNYPWVFEQLFAAAGRRMSEEIELIPVDPSVRFVWPDGGEFRLSSDLARLVAECERLDPESGPGLAAFLADAEFKYRFSFDKLVTRNARNPVRWFGALTPREMAASAVWRSLDGELRRFFRERRIREALGSYAMYLGGSPRQLRGLFSILPYGEIAYGLWLPRGGMCALPEALARVAGESGVVIRYGADVSRIRCRANRVDGVETVGGEYVAARAVVSNVDVPTTWVRLIDEPAGRRARERRARALRMTPGVVTFYWGLRAPAAGLGHHTIFLPDRADRAYSQLFEEGRLPDDIPFYVSVASATDPGLAPPGGSSVFVLVPVPALDRPGTVRDEADVRNVRDRVVARLARHGVRIAPETLAVEKAWTPATWAERYGLYQGSAFGAAHTLRQIGPFRSPNRDPRLRGLYYVGAGTVPGTGVPMTALSGAMTAEAVVRDAS